MHSIFYDPLMTIDNMGQRYIIVKYLSWFHEYLQWKDEEDVNPTNLPPPQMRAIVFGIAGSGKSAIIGILETIVRMATTINSSTLTFAPTGAAALAAGGIVPDSEWRFSRSAATCMPLKDGLQVRQLQSKYKNTVLVLNDEMSMEGRKFGGHLSGRAKEIFNMSQFQNLSMGGVPAQSS